MSRLRLRLRPGHSRAHAPGTHGKHWRLLQPQVRWRVAPACLPISTRLSQLNGLGSCRLERPPPRSQPQQPCQAKPGLAPSIHEASHQSRHSLPYGKREPLHPVFHSKASATLRKRQGKPHFSLHAPSNLVHLAMACGSSPKPFCTGYTPGDARVMRCSVVQCGIYMLAMELTGLIQSARRGASKRSKGRMLEAITLADSLSCCKQQYPEMLYYCSWGRRATNTRSTGIAIEAIWVRH